MTDKVKLLIFVSASCVVMLFFNAAAWSACKEGKTEVTIIKPNGKSLELCVADAAIPSIGGESDVVLPATCPCFSQQRVEEIRQDHLSTYGTGLNCRVQQETEITGQSSCEAVRCTGLIARKKGDNFPEGSGCYLTQDYPNGYLDPKGCWNNVDDILILPEQISDAESETCVAILKTFVE